ncbi:MAG: ABC transporter permease [Chloroflexi bacterium]|nr:ABC transporter permease [Chloroflexota bacterium]MBP8054321.1 ABC transporter permease [Chloroflexota bacterium]
MSAILATRHKSLSFWLLVGVVLVALVNGLVLTVAQWRLPLNDPALRASTPGRLSLWVAAQTEDENAEAILVRWTRPTVPDGILDEETALARARGTLGVLSLVTVVLAGYALFCLARKPERGRTAIVYLLLSYDILLLNVPPLTDEPYFALVLAGIVICLLAALMAPGHVSPRLGFFVIISTILVGWELYKLLGTATGNTLPLTDFPWKLPHWQAIAAELLEPARRNGPFLLLRILAEAAWITWTEAFLGFVVGSVLGFGLGVLFAHSRLLERGLLPYVVASQTVPIIAIAPMIVAWLGQGTAPIAVISAYLAFFPVTINTLRGLLSPEAMKLDLLHSYAASATTILFKLRVPSALPYLFSALKVASTACVVGAIVGELPSSSSDGLAAAILRASGNYAAEPEDLWAVIIMASLVGILFFSLVSLAERLVVGNVEPA